MRFYGNGEPGGIRTHDLLIKSQMLYRLSYGLGSKRTLGSVRRRVNRAGAEAMRPGLWRSAHGCEWLA
jgi:hypothetical protein